MTHLPIASIDFHQHRNCAITCANHDFPWDQPEPLRKCLRFDPTLHVSMYLCSTQEFSKTKSNSKCRQQGTATRYLLTQGFRMPLPQIQSSALSSIPHPELETVRQFSRDWYNTFSLINPKPQVSPPKSARTSKTSTKPMRKSSGAAATAAEADKACPFAWPCSNWHHGYRCACTHQTLAICAVSLLFMSCLLVLAFRWSDSEWAQNPGPSPFNWTLPRQTPA